MVDATTTKFFPLCFRMAESFEKLDNILHDWEKISTKCIVAIKALNRYKKQKSGRKKKDKAVSFLKKWLRKKNIPAVGSRARLSQTQNWSW